LCALVFTPGNGFVDLAIAVVQRFKAEQTPQPAEPGSALGLNAWFGLGLSLGKRVGAVLSFHLGIGKPTSRTAGCSIPAKQLTQPLGKPRPG
jgi:hypothetical protein